MLLCQFGGAFYIGEEEGDSASGEFIHWLFLMPTQWLVPLSLRDPSTRPNQIVLNSFHRVNHSTAHRNRSVPRGASVCRLFHEAHSRRKTTARRVHFDSAPGR